MSLMKHVLFTVVTVLLAVVLLAVPLMLRYYVYTPQRLYVATWDVVRTHKRISTVWCSAQELTMVNGTFDAYLLRHPPKVLKRHAHRQEQTVSQHFRLPNGAREYWGFHFLPGSKFSMSACARLPGAMLTVILGHRNLLHCLHDFRRWDRGDRDRSLESLESESIENVTSAITSSFSSSQGMASNESLKVFACRHALYNFPLHNSYACNGPQKDQHPVRQVTRLVLSYNVDIGGRYFFFFSSEAHLNILPNDIYLQFHLKKTRYDLQDTMANCTNVTRCELPLGLGSSDTVVLEVPSATDDTPWKSDLVTSTCQPRKGLYFIFYFMLGVVILVCAFQ